MSSSSDSSAVSLSKLPLEILEPIFILSENVALQHVCRRLYYVLNDDAVILRFCTRLFSNHGLIEEANVSVSHEKEMEDVLVNQEKGMEITATLADAQSTVLSRKWFTLDFAARLEPEVLKMQDACQNRAAKLRNEPVPDYERYIFNLAPGALVPRRAFRGPWTDYNVNFLKRLEDWGIIRSRANLDAAHEGMECAIIEGRPDVVKLLEWLNCALDLTLKQEYYRQAVILGGCNRTIIEMFVRKDDPFAWHPQSIQMNDSQVMDWALSGAEAGGEDAIWLLEFIKKWERNQGISRAYKPRCRPEYCQVCIESNPVYFPVCVWEN